MDIAAGQWWHMPALREAEASLVCRVLVKDNQDYKEKPYLEKPKQNKNKKRIKTKIKKKPTALKILTLYKGSMSF